MKLEKMDQSDKVTGYLNSAREGLRAALYYTKYSDPKYGRIIKLMQSIEELK